MVVRFLCTGNTCRSPMAAAMLAHRLRECGQSGITADSAGLCAHPDAPMSAGAIDELRRRGIPFYYTRAKRLDDALAHGALLLTMTAWQKKDVLRLFPDARCETLGDFIGCPGDIEDPYLGGPIAYRRAADQIESAVAQLLPLLSTIKE